MKRHRAKEAIKGATLVPLPEQGGCEEAPTGGALRPIASSVASESEVVESLPPALKGAVEQVEKKNSEATYVFKWFLLVQVSIALINGAVPGLRSGSRALWAYRLQM